MTASIVQYQAAIQNFEPLKEIGKAIALSGMFGCQDVHQGLVIALDCYVRGVPLLEYQARNHIIMGKPTMKYDAMLADFDRLPGCRHTVLKKEPDVASVAFYRQVGSEEIESVFTLTWEEAQKEAFVYDGKEAAILEALARGQTPPLKAKYSTPRSRGIMLFARVVSDAIRSIAPEVSAGRYTPEELEDGMLPVAAETVATQEVTRLDAPAAVPASATATPAATPTTKPAATTTATAAATSQPAINGHPAATQAANAPVSAPATAEPVYEVHLTDPITDHQVAAIKDVLRGLALAGTNLAPKIKQILSSKGLRELKDLTVGSGDQLLAALEAKQIELWAESQVSSHRDSFTEARQAG